MFPVSGPDWLIAELRTFSKEVTVSRLAGLLTLPELHAHTLRIELLVHLGACYCDGEKTPGEGEIERWLNNGLLETGAVNMEDPIEDVFVSNVMSEVGNTRIFEGIWESNDFYLQQLLEATYEWPESSEFRSLRRASLMLLRVSDLVAERSGLPRWTEGGGSPMGEVSLAGVEDLGALAGRVRFGVRDFIDFKISKDRLACFTCDARALSGLKDQTVGDSTLVKQPLLRCGEGLLLALPSAISPAARLCLLNWLSCGDCGDDFVKLLRHRQASYVFNRLVLGPLEGRPAEQVALPGKPDDLTVLDDVVVQIDANKLAHVVVLHGDAYFAVAHGLSDVAQQAPSQDESLRGYVSEAATELMSGGAYRSGLTLIVSAGVGGGMWFGVPSCPDGWYVMAIPMHDLDTLAHSREPSLLRLWKFARHRSRLREGGVRTHLFTGLLNMYACWVDNEYCLINDDVAFPGRGQVVHFTDFIGPFRSRARRGADVHAVPYSWPIQYRQVERFWQRSFFNELREAPVYISVFDILQGRLMGCVETDRGPVWLTCRTQNDTEARRLLWMIWAGLLTWLYRWAPRLDVQLAAIGSRPMHIEALFTSLDELANGSADDEGAPGASVSLDAHTLSAHLEIGKSTLRLLESATNEGEKAISSLFARALLHLAHPEVDKDEIASAVDDFLGEVFVPPGAKHCHLFSSGSVTDYLQQSSGARMRHVQPEDETEARLGLAWLVVPEGQTQVLRGRKCCRSFYEQLVDGIWGRIREKLKGLNRLGTVRYALGQLEALYADKQRWRLSARALLGLHEEAREIDAEERSRRDRATLAYRILVEMALCECATDGPPPSTADMDCLCAEVVRLIELAYQSDALRWDLAKPEIEVRANGMLSYDDAFIRETVIPYVQACSERMLAGHAESYEDLYKELPTEAKPASELYDEGFLSAFEAEYGMSVDSYIDAHAELVDMAFERKTNVVSSAKDEIAQRLWDNRGLCSEEVEAFFSSFVLAHRERWDEVPADFGRRDFYPWRFQRRLSLTMRPVLDMTGDGSQILYAVGQLKQAFGYLLDLARSGMLRQDNCRSDEMRSYLGKVADEKGGEFEVEVADHARTLGWEARQGIPMTSLTAPASLGDVDVLVWRDGCTIAFAIECKKLKFAKTIGEVGDQLSDFVGESSDLLGKHVARVEWLNKHIQQVRAAAHLPDEVCEVLVLLVTNAPVPMKFRTDLPISGDQIATKEDLADILARRC